MGRVVYRVEDDVLPLRLVPDLGVGGSVLIRGDREKDPAQIPTPVGAPDDPNGTLGFERLQVRREA